MNQQLTNKLKTLPRSSGVYFHKNIDGEVIYVGKAAILRNRVRQYFQSKKDTDAKTLALVREITDVDWITTESELDALFLESEMVKRYKPRYNILLRDDKSSVFVRISMNDKLPYVSLVRQPFSDGAEYFGPFFNSIIVKQALKYLRKVFPYFNKPGGKSSKLERQIGLAPNIADGKMTVVEYKKSLRQLISYIKGNRVAVTREIEKAMKQAANERNYEAASWYRDQLFNLMALRKQIVFGRDEFLDISSDQALVGLRDMLGLKNIPKRIEGYDVSHHSGTNNVASMVVFTNGISDKTQYRKFKLRFRGSEDYGQMRETIERRMKHLSDWGRPDLIVIDGGAGQLSAAAELLKAEKIPFIGRNKSGDHTRNAIVNIVVPHGGSYKAVTLRQQDHVAKLIARLDDEAHRFAVSYHTLLKRTKQTQSVIEEIPGIGPVTRRKLIRRFGAMANIGKASQDELIELVGPYKTELVNRQIDNWKKSAKL